MRFGAHVSSSGKISMAVDRAVDTGCDCLQIFVSSPQMWRAQRHKPEDVAAFGAGCAEHGLTPAVAHAVYLINLASADDRIWQNSIDSLRNALDIGEQLGLTGVVTHLGSSKGAAFEEVLPRLVSGLEQVLSADRAPWLLMENCAGAGNVIGKNIGELRQIADALGRPAKLGLCMDTCHAFAAGYDVADRAGLDRFVEEIDRELGLDRLKVIHANDSKGGLGSNLDRHTHIGQGAIGLDGFRSIVNHPAFANLPFILETPEIEGQADSKVEADRMNLATLRGLVG